MPRPLLARGKTFVAGVILSAGMGMGWVAGALDYVWRNTIGVRYPLGRYTTLIQSKCKTLCGWWCHLNLLGGEWLHWVVGWVKYLVCPSTSLWNKDDQHRNPYFKTGTIYLGLNLTYIHSALYILYSYTWTLNVLLYINSYICTVIYWNGRDQGRARVTNIT